MKAWSTQGLRLCTPLAGYRKARSALFVRLLALLALGAVSCAAASGYDPKRYPDSDASAPVDPDTIALAPAPKTSIADPRLAPLPPASAPAPASPPPEEDAGMPLLALMRTLEPAMRGREWPKIVALLEEIAARGKKDKVWLGFAAQGALLAKKEDVGGVRKQCDACHAVRRKPRKIP